MQPMEQLVAYIVTRRNELGLSQRDLGRISGVNPGTISSIEAGKVTKSPTNETLEKLARGLDVDANTLIDIARGRDNGRALFSLMPGILAAQAQERERRGPYFDDMDLDDLECVTEGEWAIIRAARLIGLDYPSIRDPFFWGQPAEERRATFRAIETLIDERRRLDRAKAIAEANEAPAPTDITSKRNTKYDNAPHLGDVAAGNPIVNPEWTGESGA